MQQHPHRVITVIVVIREVNTGSIKVLICMVKPGQVSSLSQGNTESQRNIHTHIHSKGLTKRNIIIENIILENTRPYDKELSETIQTRAVLPERWQSDSGTACSSYSFICLSLAS